MARIKTTVAKDEFQFEEPTSGKSEAPKPTIKGKKEVKKVWSFKELIIFSKIMKKCLKFSRRSQRVSSKRI